MAKSALKRVKSEEPELAVADELARIARRAQTSTLAFGAAIALLDPGIADFFCRARSGSMAPPLGMRLQVEHSFTGLCIQNAEILHCKDAETDDRVDTTAIRALGVRSIISVPIKDEGVVIGVLAVFSPVPESFSEMHVSALKNTADHVARLVGGDRIADKRSATPTAEVKTASTETRLALSPTVQMLRRTGSSLVPLPPKMRPTNLRRGPRASTVVLIGSLAVLLIVGVTELVRPVKLKWRPARLHARSIAARPATVSLPPATGSTEAAAPSTQPGVASLQPGGSSPVGSSDAISRALAGVSAQRENAKHTEAPAAEVQARVESTQESHTPPTSASPDQRAVADAVAPPSLGSVSPNNSLSAILGAAPSLPRQAEVCPPQLIRGAPIVYPEFARERRIRSLVLVRATIAADGKVAKAEFAGGLPIFRDAALDAVRRRRYKPATRDGQPVEQQIEIQLDFHP